MARLRKTSSKPRKRWVVRPELLKTLKTSSCVSLPTKRSLSPSPPPPDMASLVNEAAMARELLMTHTPLATEGHRTATRAKNFPFKPDAATLKAFKRYGFDDWLRRIKGDSSVATTTKQLAEFIAWFNQAKCVNFYIVLSLLNCSILSLLLIL